MSEYTEDKRRLLKSFSQNLKIVAALYPNNLSSISQLALKIDWDQGTVSKAVNNMLNFKLLEIKEVIHGKGKPQRIIALTDFSVRLYSLVNNYLAKKMVAEKFSDPRVLDQYFQLLELNDPQLIKIAIEGLHAEATDKVYPDDKYLEKLRVVIFNSGKASLKKELIGVLQKIANHSNEQNFEKIDRLFREDLTNTFYEKVEKTDEAEAVRIVSLKTLAEIIPTSKKYEMLREAYTHLIIEDSSYTKEARGLILTKFPEKVSDLKLDLIKLATKSNTNIKERVGNELKEIF